MRAPALLCTLALAGTGWCQERAARTTQPNFIVVLCDDLGFGDLGCFGHPTIATPEIDRMAREGVRLTEFYTASSVCTPSRAGLLTGRLPIRSGMCGHKRRAVMRTNGIGGLPESEITIADALKKRGYATMALGKWHLGHLPQHLPTRHGFDAFVGMPYSNDMRPYYLIRGEKRVAGKVDQTKLTALLTDEALRFIEAKKHEPFFLYLAHAFPHTPLHASAAQRGRSRRGLYGDVVADLDVSTGRILARLRELGIDKRTLVVFTSDNGPWLIRRLNGGSAGPLRDGKGSTFDGGMHVPAVAWWPGRIKPGRTVRQMASTMDLFATFVGLAGGKLPADRVYDSFDLAPVLLGTGPATRDHVFFYRGKDIMAVRLGAYKAHWFTQPAYGRGRRMRHDPPLLFNVERDPSERHPLKNAGVIEHITALRDRHAASFTPPPSQLERFPRK